MALGTFLVMLGLWRNVTAPLPRDVAARVNDATISQAEWRRAVDAANAGRRQPLDPAGEQRILDTLIREELLLQTALDLGLAHHLPVVRGTLVQAMLDTLAGPADDTADRPTLVQFLEDHPEIARLPEQREVQLVRYRSAEDAAQDRHGAPVPLPAGPITERLLARQVGGELARWAFAAPRPGWADQVLTVGEGWYRLQVQQITPSRQMVAAEHDWSAADEARVQRLWQRQQREQRLARALYDLDQAADIRRTALASEPALPPSAR